MNIVLLKPEDWIDEQRVLLKDQRATHIRKVLRASAGDTLRVGRLGGACGQGLIESLDAHGVVLSTVLTEAPPRRHPFDLVGLPSCEDPERNVVEDTKPAPTIPFGVMPGWAHEGVSVSTASLQHSRYRRVSSSCGQPRNIKGSGTCPGSVSYWTPCGSRLRLNEVDVLRRVKAKQG